MKRFLFFMFACSTCIACNSQSTPSNTDTMTYVDLGLSVKWAKCNVGASEPFDYGNYYAWGETTPKSIYDYSTYKHKEGYIGAEKVGTEAGKTIIRLNKNDDVAYNRLGNKWRMPTAEEWKELKNKCEWEWSTQNNVNGYIITGPNGNKIFLPAGGYRAKEHFDGVGTRVDYWSSEGFWENFHAGCLYGEEGWVRLSTMNASYGRLIRAVYR